MSWTVRTVCIAMLRNEGLIYDICKFYFLGTWSFWTTPKKQSGNQNRHLSWVTIHLCSRLNFSSLKDWFTIANYFLYKNASASYYYTIEQMNSFVGFPLRNVTSGQWIKITGKVFDASDSFYFNTNRKKMVNVTILDRFWFCNAI